ncbi:hypothetical protein TNCV_4078901 [Trichonephila clavipes]|nr:hypothetical protein TNCV_4078901 [Trichonephila clavipes]
MGSRTSSRYRTAVKEPRLKMCRLVRYPHKIPALTHNASALEFLMFGADCRFLVYAIFLYACPLAPEKILTHQ